MSDRQLAIHSTRNVRETAGATSVHRHMMTVTGHHSVAVMIEDGATVEGGAVDIAVEVMVVIKEGFMPVATPPTRLQYLPVRIYQTYRTKSLFPKMGDALTCPCVPLKELLVAH